MIKINRHKNWIMSVGTVLSTLILSINSPADASIEQKLCQRKGEYAIFAQHPLYSGAWGRGGVDGNRPRGTSDNFNLELSHEHIFFCRSNQIVDNIGFGPTGRFRYSQNTLQSGREENGGRVDDFVLISNKRYDSNVIKQVLAGVTAVLPDRCEFKPRGDGIYGGVVNNCQGFTERIRKDYEKVVVPEIVRISCTTCDTSSGVPVRFSFIYKDRNDDAMGWEISYQQNPNTPVFSGKLKGCEVEKDDSCGGVGASTISYFVSNMGGNCKQNNKQACIYRFQLVVIDKERNRSKAYPFTLRISSQ